jgi:gamma-glutamyltranspeptidase / glutathione hydrolase
VRPVEPAPERQPVLAGDGMVAASHPAVSLAGARILAEGGNAVDATLAMAAMSWLALPGQCGIGGDAFAVVRNPDGQVWTVCGSGYGPDGGDPAFYRERGLAAVPLEGPLAVTVPGAVAALDSLHRAGGSRRLEDLWAPAVTAARRGLPCTAKTRDDIRAHQDALARDPGTAAVFLPGGQLPRVGQRLTQPELAATMEAVAKAPDGFYAGALADLAVRWLADEGAPFSGDEWAAAGSIASEPALARPYGPLTLHETPLPTPGWMVLQQAALCDRALRDLDWLGADAVSWLASAARIAFQDRWERCAADNDAWRELLTDRAVGERRERIAAGVAPVPVGVRPDGDTTSTVAVDADGRAVSFIHSLAFTFGARVTVPGTGVVLNNRLARGVYLVDGHPNEIRPRRRPLHTLNAWILTDDEGNLVHIGNTPGGDGQVQWNMQLVSHLVDHGLDPQTAVSAPRFTVFPGSDADAVGQPSQLRCEARLGERVLDRLAEIGHKVTVLEPWAAGGSALVVSADRERGCLVGGVDPRQEGVALGV